MKTNDINRMIDEMINNRKTVNILLAKALDQAVPETWSYLTSDQVEKLAEKLVELTIKECMQVVVRKCASPTAYEALAEHFGVKE